MTNVQRARIVSVEDAQPITKQLLQLTRRLLRAPGISTRRREIATRREGLRMIRAEHTQLIGKHPLELAR